MASKYSEYQIRDTRIRTCSGCGRTIEHGEPCKRRASKKSLRVDTRGRTINAKFYCSDCYRYADGTRILHINTHTKITKAPKTTGLSQIERKPDTNTHDKTRKYTGE